MAEKKTKDNSKEQKKPNLGIQKNGKPKFNIMWVYIALCAVLLVVWQMGSSSGPSKEVFETEFQTLIAEKDVEKLTYVRKNDRLEIYLKETSVKMKSKYKDFREKNLKGPHYYMLISDYSVFNSNL